MTAIDTTPEVDTAQAANVAGLRALADLLDSNPVLAEHVSPNRILAYVGCEDAPVALMAAFARAGMALGLPVAKDYDDDYGSVTLTFGAVELYVYANREQVCERIVVGTETVTKTVKDPEALAAVPEVEVTETVEQVEWRCSPLLAEASA